MRPTMEVETLSFCSRSSTASLSLPQRGNCNRKVKTFLSKRKGPSRPARLMGTVAAPFQAGQIQWLVALEPTIEGLTRNPEMTPGQGHVLRATMKIHPSQADLRCPAQLHSGRR